MIHSTSSYHVCAHPVHVFMFSTVAANKNSTDSTVADWEISCVASAASWPSKMEGFAESQGCDQCEKIAGDVKKILGKTGSCFSHADSWPKSKSRFFLSC